MRARDTHQGAICVGTNAVYRREALDARGGMALLEHCEDIFTGMKVIDAGYRVAYLPLPLAAGSTPDTVRSLASQQYRWARGNFALAGTPLFKRMRLTFMQRLGDLGRLDLLRHQCAQPGGRAVRADRARSPRRPKRSRSRPP